MCIEVAACRKESTTARGRKRSKGWVGQQKQKLGKGVCVCDGEREREREERREREVPS